MNSSSRKNEIKADRRLKNLIDVNQHFAEIESLEELFPLMLDLAKHITEAEAASLLLYNPVDKVLEFAAITDDSLDREKIEILRNTIKIKIGEGIAGRVAENRYPLIIDDAQNDNRFLVSVDKKTGVITRNLLSVPLIHNSELLGVLNVLNSTKKNAFDIEDQEILLGYSYLASVAIIRSKLIESRLAQHRLETQLTTAAKIQSLFWPEIPELGMGSHVWAMTKPAAFVGGDLYDFIPLSDGSWVFYVADVSDKGLPAAMVMVALWSKIRSEVLLHKNLESLLSAINNSMYDLLHEEGFFATIILGQYWSETGKISFVRGGHLFPILISNGNVKEIDDLEGISLGIVKNAAYSKSDIILSPGESVIFLSDGVTESENQQKIQFGSHRIIDCLKEENNFPRSYALYQKIKAWQKNTNPNDDLTILEIWRDN